MLDRVTITGADDSVRPEQLWELSREFPFVEWAILWSRARTEREPRWPTRSWVDALVAQALQRPEEFRPRFATHLCGGALRAFLIGDVPLEEYLLTVLSDRIQLNTHGQPARWDARAIAHLLRSRSDVRPKQIIQQIDGGVGEQILNDLLAEEVNGYAFFDLSHGAGITPDRWPSPEYIGDCGPNGEQQYAYHGYGGGLGPDNLAAEIPRILEAAKGHPSMIPGRIWIDMETKVRSVVDGRDVFDLDKVRRCLEIAAPFVGKA